MTGSSPSLRDHADKGLVIFCGAGVSMVAPSLLPSWWQMNEQVVLALSRQIEPFCGAERVAHWARQINARRDSRRFPPEFQAEIIQKHFGDDYFRVLECLDGKEPNTAHMAIAALARSGHVRAVVTSNFDGLIELAFEALDVPLDVHFQATDFEALAAELESPAAPAARCRLLKLHGSVADHRTLVDTLAQRMRGFSPAVCTCLRHLLRRHHWLFLGYSGGDLEGNAQYLCLRSEVQQAVGFTWLVRDSAKDEPIDAVVKLRDLYGARAETPRGELPDWLLEQFGTLIPEEARVPVAWSAQELERRKLAATQSIVDHTREWSASVGGVRAALILAEMLDESVSHPQAAEELLTLALKAPGVTPLGHAAVANKLANMLRDAGRHDEAMELARMTLAGLGPEQQAYRGAVLTTMGLIEHQSGRGREALELLAQAYECSVALHDDDARGAALHNRAMVLKALGRHDEATASYEEALEIVRRKGDVMAQAQTLNNIGDLLGEQGRYEEAINILKQAVTLRERLGDDAGVAKGLGNIAGAHKRQGKLAEATSTYEEILAIFRRVGARPDEVITLHHLGQLAEERERREEAIGLYRQALAIANDCGLRYERAHGLQKLASLWHTPERHVESRALFDEALSLIREGGDPSREAGALNDLGVFLLETGQLDSARSTFEQAIKMRESLKQDGELCTALGNLALVCIKKGGAREGDEALALLKRRLSIAEGLADKGLIANAHSYMAMLFERQDKREEMLGALETAQRLHVEMGEVGRALEALGALGERTGHMGQIGVSLQWFDKAIALATTDAQRKRIAKRLTSVLEVVLKSGHGELIPEFDQRLQALGMSLTIERR